MDKEFEALEILSRALEFNDEGNFQSGRLWRLIFNDMVDDKEKATIEQALIELKQIKEAKPSEAMECLHTIAFNTQFIAGMNFGNELRTINQALLKAQEFEKKNAEYKEVLRIIKEKPQVELFLIQLGEIKTYEEYLDRAQQWEGIYWDMIYTEEEFDLLKHYFRKII